MRQRGRIAARAIVLALFFTGASLAEAALPPQFIAKMYTEALGRAPEQDGWMGNLDYFAANGCPQGTLKVVGRVFYLSGEYNSSGYDNAAKLLTLYRGVLNREPDPGGYESWLNFLNGGAGFPGGTGAQLQALLNAAAPGSAVLLAQKAVIRLTATLVIPVGVTLTTQGNPLPNRYALMGRIVRDPSQAGKFAQVAVELRSGAVLSNVWVDGQRSPLGGLVIIDAVNAYAPRGGTGMQIVNNRLSDTLGWTHVIAHGSAETLPCGSLRVASNLVTAYVSSHPNAIADGLSSSCENATIEFNEIIDTTDVAIVVFRAGPVSGTVAQHSQIRFNTILNAGNSAYAAIVADPLLPPYSNGTQNFTGMSANDNTLWTGPFAHFDIALSVGTRPWFGDLSNRGSGASFVNNTTGPNPRVFARVNSAIVVSGMMDAQGATTCGSN